jgi:hypothetical protein
MNKQTIINIIVNHKPYANYCKKLCFDRDIHNDLYQEFFLVIADKSEEILINAFNNNLLESYCLSIIYNLNLQRHRFMKVKGNDNPLLEHCNYTTELSRHLIEDSYNHSIDDNYNRVMEFIKTNEQVKQSDVFVLFESLDNQIKQIAKDTDISYSTLRQGRKRLINNIKQNVRI